MKEFFIYFFGKGDNVEFTNFTAAHIVPIIIMLAVILLIAKFANKIRDAKYEKSLRYIIAFASIISEMAYYWRLTALPDVLKPNALEHLPITVCGWAVVFCSYMVIDKSQTLFDISYFWLLSGSVFALITPTVISYTGPTRFRYYQFWVEHTVGYIAIFYMIFVHKMRPTIKSAIKSYSLFVVLAAIAYYANRLLGPGANYLFMAELEETKSILDILPRNFVLRVLVMASIVTLMFFVAYLPWLIKDIKAKKAAPQTKEKEIISV